jgi:hypothetical protein
LVTDKAQYVSVFPAPMKPPLNRRAPRLIMEQFGQGARAYLLAREALEMLANAERLANYPLDIFMQIELGKRYGRVPWANQPGKGGLRQWSQAFPYAAVAFPNAFAHPIDHADMYRGSGRLGHASRYFEGKFPFLAVDYSSKQWGLGNALFATICWALMGRLLNHNVYVLWPSHLPWNHGDILEVLSFFTMPAVVGLNSLRVFTSWEDFKYVHKNANRNSEFHQPFQSTPAKVWEWLKEQHGSWVDLPELKTFALAVVRFRPEKEAQVDDWMRDLEAQVGALGDGAPGGPLRHVAIQFRRSDWLKLGTRALNKQDQLRTHVKMNKEVVELVTYYYEHTEAVYFVHLLCDSLSSRNWASQKFAEQIAEGYVTLGMNKGSDYSIPAREDLNTSVLGTAKDYILAGKVDRFYGLPGSSLAHVVSLWYDKPLCAVGSPTALWVPQSQSLATPPAFIAQVCKKAFKTVCGGTYGAHVHCVCLCRRAAMTPVETLLLNDVADHQCKEFHAAVIGFCNARGRLEPPESRVLLTELMKHLRGLTPGSSGTAPLMSWFHRCREEYEEAHQARGMNFLKAFLNTRMRAWQYAAEKQWIFDVEGTMAAELIVRRWDFVSWNQEEEERRRARHDRVVTALRRVARWIPSVGAR